MTSTKITTQRTPFEKDLQTYFPELHKFWSLSKFDKHQNKLIDAILDMVNKNKTGVIEIQYNNGRISYIFKRENLVALTNKTGI